MSRARLSLFAPAAPAALAAFVATGAACSAVLGLDPPTLDPCASGGCADVNVPITEDGSVLAPEAAPDTAAPSVDASDASFPDDVVITADGNGVRCGSFEASTYCATGICCLVMPEAGPASYACAEGLSDCPGYPISCAWNSDCAGTDVCCFYGSAMKCEPENTTSCQPILVCDPSGPTDQCPGGSTCTVAVARDGQTLPYYICSS